MTYADTARRRANWLSQCALLDTNFAPAVAITEVVSAIVGDKRRILPVSVYSQEHNIYVSSLAQVSAFGAKSIFMHLNAEEKKQMEASVAILKQACAETGV